GADFPEPTEGVIRHQPTSIRAERGVDQAFDVDLCDFRGIADVPDLKSVLAMAAGRQPFAVRADGNTAAIVQRPHRDRPLGGRDKDKVTVGQGHDPARSVFGNRAISGWQGERTRGADTAFTPVAVKPDRPAPHAERTACEQVARGFEPQMPGETDPREG